MQMLPSAVLMARAYHRSRTLLGYETGRVPCYDPLTRRIACGDGRNVCAFEVSRNGLRLRLIGVRSIG
jgi:hypothetical protein